jgi:drug/metabolite transporter (DMT)-like permease
MIPEVATGRRKIAEAGLWIVPAVWSSNYLIARAAAGIVPPHLLAFGRWSVVFVVIACWRYRSLWRNRAVVARELPRSMMLGALGMWICGAWVYLGGHSTSATNIGLIYAAAPVGIAIGGAWLLGQYLSRRQMLAMASALAGVLVVVFRGDPANVLRMELHAGDVWIAAATLAWVAYSLLLTHWRSALDAADRLCVISGCGLVFLLPSAAGEWIAGESLTPRAYELMAVAGLLPGLASYLAYAILQRELGVARTGLMMYLAPVYGAGLAWALLGEAPGWHHLAGAALILPGIRYSAPDRLPETR